MNYNNLHHTQNSAWCQQDKNHAKITIASTAFSFNLTNLLLAASCNESGGKYSMILLLMIMVFDEFNNL